MRARCKRPTDKRYNRYGGRGIKVCNEWDDFATFRSWAYSHGYQEGLSIERQDNDGDYCPENCIWATPKIQANNQSTTTILKIGDVEKSLHSWAEFAGIAPEALRHRIYAGWDVKTAVFTRTSRKRTRSRHRAALSERGGTDGVAE